MVLGVTYIVIYFDLNVPRPFCDILGSLVIVLTRAIRQVKFGRVKGYGEAGVYEVHSFDCSLVLVAPISRSFNYLSRFRFKMALRQYMTALQESLLKWTSLIVSFRTDALEMFHLF